MPQFSRPLRPPRQWQARPAIAPQTSPQNNDDISRFSRVNRADNMNRPNNSRKIKQPAAERQQQQSPQTAAAFRFDHRAHLAKKSCCALPSSLTRVGL